MMNLREIAKFVLVKEGECLELSRAERRVVRLELNTAAPCQLKLQTGPEAIRFLANVDGRETLEFIAEGPVAIWPDCEDEVWLWTAELESSAVVVEDAQTFTKIAQRRARNHELERVAAKLQQNMERRFVHLQGEADRVRAENDRLKAEAAKDEPKRKAASAAPAKPAPDGDAGKPADPPAAGADGAAGDGKS